MNIIGFIESISEIDNINILPLMKHNHVTIIAPIITLRLLFRWPYHAQLLDSHRVVKEISIKILFLFTIVIISIYANRIFYYLENLKFNKHQ